MTNYNVAVKINGKFRTLGKIRPNKWGNMQLSFKKSQELQDYIDTSGDWLNFSLFEEKEEKKEARQPSEVLDDEIPF